MSRSRRHVRTPPDLTSLFDVLFIVIFVALIRAAAAQQTADAAAAEAAKPKAPPVPVHLDPTSLRARALAGLGAELAAKTPVVVRIAAKGTITALEVSGQTIKLDTPLVEQNADPRVRMTYLGDRSAELRVCRVVALHLGVPDLLSHLVIIAPELPLDELTDALGYGITRDVERCLSDQRGVATIVDPTATPGTATGSNGSASQP